MRGADIGHLQHMDLVVGGGMGMGGGGGGKLRGGHRGGELLQ